MAMLITDGQLREFAKRIFEQVGATEDRAWQVAEHLVEANLKGHDSHGVGMIPNYVNGVRRGNLHVNEDAELVLDKGAVLLVDGHFGFGQVVAKQATQMGIERAKQIGMACVGSKNNYHIGRVGTYGEQCAREGLISIHFVNVVGHAPFVSPWGGRDKRMQTNPFCCAIPTAGDPIVLDMATSAIALGKARVARMKGVAVPEGSVYDAEGQPSTDPNVLEQGGSLAPFGEHKGYGLALICELLGGGLAGEWTMQDVDKQTDMTINHMLEFIIDPNLFGGLEAFQEEVEGMSRWLQESKPAVGNDRVRLPGEPERESMRMRTANGIPLDDGSWGSIIKAAQIAGMSDETIKSLTE
jgi:hydroxycarboxylate dehydrogenase B